MNRVIETTRFRYKLLTPNQRFGLLKERDKLKRKQTQLEEKISILEDCRNNVISAIRKLTRQIDTGKVKLGTVKKKKVTKGGK